MESVSLGPDPALPELALGARRRWNAVTTEPFRKPNVNKVHGEARSRLVLEPNNPEKGSEESGTIERSFPEVRAGSGL